jgi:hypothetical protein
MSHSWPCWAGPCRSSPGCHRTGWLSAPRAGREGPTQQGPCRRSRDAIKRGARTLAGGSLHAYYLLHDWLISNARFVAVSAHLQMEFRKVTARQCKRIYFLWNFAGRDMVALGTVDLNNEIMQNECKTSCHEFLVLQEKA